MMKLPHHTLTFTVFILLSVSAGALVLYAQGYRLNIPEKSLEKTGIILTKSNPEGAKVYLDGELVTATNSPITDLEEKTYHLKIEKEGYFPWEDDVPVKEGFVTNVDALLPPLSPSLTAVTKNGVSLTSRSPSGQRAVFISKRKLYLIGLTSQRFGFLRSSPQQIGEETPTFPLSQTTAIDWSPDEDQLLITAKRRHYQLPIESRNERPTLIKNKEKLLDLWRAIIAEQKAGLIERDELDEKLIAKATDYRSVWSPDERRFLYEKRINGKRQFWVVNLSDPLPIGDEKHQMVWETRDNGLSLFWLADSCHFAMIDRDPSGDGSGTVSILDLNGENKRDLFTGTITEAIALSTSDLSKIIVPTSLSSTAPPNLYAISLR